MQISYHVSQEQFSPGALLGFVQRAEAAGFDAAFTFRPLPALVAVPGAVGLHLVLVGCRAAGHGASDLWRDHGARRVALPSRRAGPGRRNPWHNVSWAAALDRSGQWPSAERGRHRIALAGE